MIGLIAAMLIAPTRILEFADKQANEISIQALVTLPILGAKDLSRLEILAEAIPKQTQDYPRREMLMVTDGRTVHCEVTPDVLRLIVNVSPGKLKSGLSLMEALIRNATLTQSNLDAAAQDKIERDYWSAALQPYSRPFVKPTVDEAQLLYRRIFRPERILLSVGGKFNPGEAEQAWTARMDHWNVEREPRGYFDNTGLEERARNPGAITTIDFVAAPVAAGDTTLPSRILALFALGVGKGGSLFRIVREKHAWSYRQDAILSPTRDGWVPRLLIACIPSDDTSSRVAAIKADLLADIDGWTAASLGRAVGMAEAVFIYQVPYSPLYVLGDAPVGNSLQDQVFMRAYWQMKTGQPWNPASLVDSMEKVSLDELKDQARSILTTAISRVLPGQ